MIITKEKYVEKIDNEKYVYDDHKFQLIKIYKHKYYLPNRNDDEKNFIDHLEMIIGSKIVIELESVFFTTIRNYGFIEILYSYFEKHARSISDINDFVADYSKIFYDLDRFE